MKLTARTDIEAPLSFVFATLADHGAWEREAVRRGADIERPADMPISGVGAGWRVRFQFRGKRRKVLLRIDALAPDEGMSFSFEGQALEGFSVLELTALSPRQTRLHVQLQVKPKTLAARLFINTIRLAKGRVQRRFNKRLGLLATRIQDRYIRSRAPSGRS
jgi:hypothetical protein